MTRTIKNGEAAEAASPVLSKPVERFRLQSLSVRGKMNLPRKLYMRSLWEAFCFGKNALSHFAHPKEVVKFAWQQRESAFFVARLRLRHFFMRRISMMPDYENLYHRMVNASEDALAALEAGNFGAARQILINAERQAEEQYIRTAEE